MCESVLRLKAHTFATFLTTLTTILTAAVATLTTTAAATRVDYDRHSSSVQGFRRLAPFKQASHRL